MNFSCKATEKSAIKLRAFPLTNSLSKEEKDNLRKVVPSRMKEV